MRILLVVPMVPRDDGAGAIPLLLHAELAGLRERHQVTLVTAVGDEPGETEAAARLQRSGVGALVADRRQPKSAAGRWRRRWRLGATWARSGWPWRTVWFADPGVQSLIDQAAATRTFDVVAVEDSSMAVFRLPSGVPAVLTEHEAHRAPAPEWRRGPLAGLPRRCLAAIDWRRLDGFQRGSWGRFDRIQVFTRGDAEAVAALDPSLAPKLRVNPFGVELPAAADPARQEEGTLVFVGNFTHPPNCDAATWLAREILPAVRTRVPAARLRIVGSSPPAAVRSLAGPGVEIVADAPSVEPHIEAAVVVLAPVRTGGGMRMKVLEAIARGKAVVTTRLGAEGFAEFGTEPPLRIADDVDGIATLAAGLLTDPGKRRELERSARSFAEQHFTPRAWADRLTRVYEDATASVAG